MHRFPLSHLGFWAAVAGVLLLVGAAPASASVPKAASVAEGTAVAIDVETHSEVLESSVLADGTEIRKWVPATAIKEGQMVYFTVSIRNSGERAAHDVVVTKAVPANTRYVADSAAAPGAMLAFSTDGGVTFAAARSLVVRDDRGVLRPAPPESYTHIRWQLRYPLAPGAIAYARFRAVFR